MTISTNTDVIAGEDLSAQPEKILHTDDIAGTAKASPKNSSRRNTPMVALPLNWNRFSLMA